MADWYTPTDEDVREAWVATDTNPEGYALVNLDPPSEAESRAGFAAFLARVRAEALREGARGLSWFGAQGNTLDHLTSWQVVAECMKALRDEADRIEKGADRG